MLLALLETPVCVSRSCKKNPSLRRVVFTSSSSTVRVKDKFDPEKPVDESSWSSVEICEKYQIWYVLSKTMAEKAAWEFCNENGINLVTLLPSFLVGPSLPPTLCSTASDILGLLKGNFSSLIILTTKTITMCFILFLNTYLDFG